MTENTDLLNLEINFRKYECITEKKSYDLPPECFYAEYLKLYKSYNLLFEIVKYSGKSIKYTDNSPKCIIDDIKRM